MNSKEHPSPNSTPTGTQERFGCCKRQGRRGRKRGLRRIGRLPGATLFKPAGIPISECGMVTLSFAELEALRLVDMIGLTQEEAAARMGISRRTFWKDLQEVRRKVALALTGGLAIRIDGGDFQMTEGFSREPEELAEKGEGSSESQE